MQLNQKTAPDGIYHVRTFSGETMRAEKIDGKWYWSDGTGWREEVKYPQEIVHAIEVSHLPTIKPNYDYGAITYPLSEFLPGKTKV